MRLMNWCRVLSVLLAGIAMGWGPTGTAAPRDESNGMPRAAVDGSDRRDDAGKAEAASAQRAGERDYVEGELLVRFKPRTSRARKRSMVAELGMQSAPGFRAKGMALMRFDKGRDMASVRAALEKRPEVAYTAPNHRLYLQRTPNDPRYNELWGLNNTGQTGGDPDADIDAPAAWDQQTGTNDVVVAVIDTGIDPDHADLADNVWNNPVQAKTSFNDGQYGYDAVDPGTEPLDNDGHGTHVAGTIGAVGDNGTGVTGVNWDVELLTCRIFDELGGTTARAIDCLDYILELKQDHGVNIQVTNNSWGGAAFNRALKDKIEELQRANILFVAAAGNDQLNNDYRPTYPASYALDNIIAVSATDDTDALSGLSNFGGQSVDIGAPGVGVLSTVPGDAYGVKSGTSMATPHVAGTLALIQATKNSAKTDYRLLRDALLVSGDRIRSFDQDVLSGDRLNANSTLRQGLTGLPPVIDGLDPFRATSGDSIVIDGARFGSSAGDVFFPASGGGEVAATVDAWRGDEVSVSVPANATDGRLRLETASGEQASAPVTVGPLLRRRAPLTTGVFRGAAASTGGWTVTMGGTAEGGLTRAVQRYDAASNTLTSGAQLPVATSRATAGAINGRIYLAGGITPDPSGGGNRVVSDLRIYDPGRDQWSKGPAMRRAVQLAGSAVIDGELYVVGGLSGGRIQRLVQIYDPAEESWRLGPSLSQGRYDHAVGSIGSELYAVGGLNGGRLASVERWRTDSASGWQSVAGLTPARTGLAVASGSSQLYAVSGLNSDRRGNCLDGVDVYDPDDDRWFRLESRLNAPRVDAATAVDGRTVRVMGGSYCDSTRTAASVFTANEALDLVRIGTVQASPRSGQPPLEVDFTATASRGNGDLSYRWDFGDGSSSDKQNPTHTYDEEAFYDVELEVTDAQGVSDIRTKRVTVGDPGDDSGDGGGGGCSALPMQREGGATSYGVVLPLLLMMALLGVWRRRANHAG